MAEQNYKNHRQMVPIYNYVISTAIVAVLIGSIVNVVNSSDKNLYSASLLVVVSLILVGLYLYARAFPLKAQDRAIRAEENLRHFALTGKLLDNRLKIKQIVALRFASDEEFVGLAQRAANENLSNNAIKKQIKNWRGDYYRV
ncbi:MAG: DUF6526 family protein [Chitinophagaceae bacterium]